MRSFYHLVTHSVRCSSRCIAGALNGNMGVTKSVVADITDHTNLAQAFVLIVPVFSVGSSIAYVNEYTRLCHLKLGCSDLFMAVPFLNRTTVGQISFQECSGRNIRTFFRVSYLRRSLPSLFSSPLYS